MNSQFLKLIKLKSKPNFFFTQLKNKFKNRPWFEYLWWDYILDLSQNWEENFVIDLFISEYAS